MTRSASDGGRGLVRRHRLPRLVWCVTAALGIQILVWALLIPPHEGPDEANHSDLVLHLAEGFRYPEYDERWVGEGAMSYKVAYVVWAQLGGTDVLTADRVLPRSERPTYDELGGDEPVSWSRPNQMPQHPPLYYASAATVLRAERFVLGGKQALEREQLVMRLAGGLLLLPLPVLAWSASRRLGLGDVVAATAATMVLAVPQLQHLGATVSNDPPLILLAAIAATLAAGAMTAGPDARRAWRIGVVLGLMLLVKGFAFIVIGWVLAGRLALGLWRPAWRRSLWRGTVVLVTTATAVGGWFWVRNLLVHGEAGPTIAPRFFYEAEGFEPDVLDWVQEGGHRLVTSFWGYFGWLTVPLPAVVVASMTAALAVVVAAAFRRPLASLAGAGAGAVERRLLAVYVSIVPMLLVYVLYKAWVFYARSGMKPFLQGRYLYSGLVPLVVVAAVGAVRLGGRRAPAFALAVAAAMTMVSWSTVLGAWWTDTGVGAVDAARAVDAWNPVVDGFAALAAVAAVVVAACAVRALRRWHREPVEAPDVLEPFEQREPITAG